MKTSDPNSIFKNDLLNVTYFYLGPLPLDEHRPMTTPCQRTLFWSDLAAPVMLLHKY
jgi:hypothetical protein